MRWRDLPRRVMVFVLPWPQRRERRAAIEAARREKERSQRAAERAAVIERQLGQIAANNHFAEVIADQLLARHYKR